MNMFDTSMSSSQLGKRRRLSYGIYQPTSRDRVLNDLPDHLIYEIFLRSSAESLLRLKSVCKAWYSLIKDRNFAKLHYDHNKTKKQSIGIIFISRREYISQYDLTIVNNLWEYEEVHLQELKLTVGTEEIVKMTSCNGLVFFHTEFPLLIWNPITRESVELPPRRMDGDSKMATACGIGYHAANNEYRVVQLL
ncbi:hypothetical protein C5167_046955 [Papaver somniferum]|uniref:F-box domain-containing protein n=1 Tax=Papaver somniferum TaxID=3469 RepID=A0A4Y7LJ16_PAPSO|nr:putative F-box protein At3g21120 [Papaver somniferum]RZC84169.1 hypothetical protein C5167_046955 [Papaver somniferum]